VNTSIIHKPNQIDEIAVISAEQTLAQIGRVKSFFSEAHRKAADVLVRDSSDIELVSSHDSCEAACRMYSEISSLMKQIEEYRADVKRPVLDACKAVDSSFAEVTDGLEKEKARLKAEIERHQQSLWLEYEKKKKDREVKLEEFGRRLQTLNIEMASVPADSQEFEKMSAEKAELTSKVIEAAKVEKPKKMDSATISVGYKAVVYDIEALAKQRPDLVEMVPNMKKIQSLEEDDRIIDGVTFVPNATVRSKSI